MPIMTRYNYVLFFISAEFHVECNSPTTKPELWWEHINTNPCYIVCRERNCCLSVSTDQSCLCQTVYVHEYYGLLFLTESKY